MFIFGLIAWFKINDDFEVTLAKKASNIGAYRVGKIKRGQVTFLLVTSEPIYKIKWFLAGINYIEQQVTWYQFYLNESLESATSIMSGW